MTTVKSTLRTVAAADHTPRGEAGRLSALKRYEILDTPHEPAFDRIVKLAALLLDVPVALISLVDADRQWFKAHQGIHERETPRTVAFCDHAIRGHDILVVPDASDDVRFRDNPLVTGAMHVRFYAGAPLVTPDGFALGTICGIDRVPRQLNARDAEVLTALAEQVVQELEIRSALGELYREVAEGRRSDRTLQGEQAKLETLLNFSECAVIMIGPDGQIASLNRAAQAMFGFEPGECIGSAASGLIRDETALPGGEAVTRYSAGIGHRKDGTRFAVEVARASWNDAQGSTTSAAIVRDVTKRRLAEDEARRREAAAHDQDKLAALGRIAGGVAHELNNLLQPIIGLTQLELEQMPTEGTPEQMDTRDSLALILESGQQARDVVRKLQIFARKAKPEVAPTEFPAALRRAVAAVAGRFPPAIRLDFTIDVAAVGFANINESELIEILANLADNAATAMDGSGAVVIKAHCVDAPDPSLGIASAPAFCVTVADTGCGMDVETRARIFEPFFTTKPVGQGTGLGLSIVHGVLRDWKGGIAVDTTPGQGSTFAIYIPVIQNA